MSQKRFITAQELLVDSFRLAHQVFLSGFRPDFIVGIWRGPRPITVLASKPKKFVCTACTT